MMKRYVRLSYDIGENTPLYPGINPVAIRKVKEISKGDSCNTFLITFSNHTGTHIDAPGHFWNSGRTISEYSLEELVFKNPFLVDCPKGIDEVIEINDFDSLRGCRDTDLILIRTGFHKYRSEDVYTYCYKNPCFLPETAVWIRNNFPNMRAIGIDCISIASHSHRELGRETHKILLKEDGFRSSSFLILEDLRLSYEIKKIDELIVSPVFIEGIDSTPCTVIGVIND